MTLKFGQLLVFLSYKNVYGNVKKHKKGKFQWFS